MNENNKKNYKEGLRDGIPIALGYLAVSFSLGIAAKNYGLTAVQATVMSITNSTSAGEFAAIAAIGAGTSIVELAIMQFVINLRYMLMSCVLSQKIDKDAPYYHRFIMGGGITDEIFGISAARNKLNPFYTYGAMSTAIPAWALGTCLGVIMGNILPVNVVSALSVALYGMFVAIIVPPSRDNKILGAVVIVAMLVSLSVEYIPVICNISSGTKVIILTVIISAIAALLFPVKDEEAGDKEACDGE